VERDLDSGVIEIAPLAFMRGRVRCGATIPAVIGGTTDVRTVLADLPSLTRMYGPAVRLKKFRRSGLRSCINVSGL